MLALHWKLGQKIVATLTSPGDEQSTPYVATRADDRTLGLDNPDVDDGEGRRVASAFAALNRLARFVATAGGFPGRGGGRSGGGGFGMSGTPKTVKVTTTITVRRISGVTVG